jgi:hypothetical protein
MTIRLTRLFDKMTRPDTDPLLVKMQDQTALDDRIRGEEQARKLERA